MTWGALFMCYECPKCGKKFRYDLGMMAEDGPDFGTCPNCGTAGKYIKEGPVSKEIMEYEEAE